MTALKQSVKILLADDDAEDRQMAREALIEARLLNEVDCVEDGQELLDYLNNEGKFQDSERYSLPGLILLDLNMPKMDGREALKEIRSSERLRRLPIIVLTTSKAEEDIVKTYDLGVNSFISKPVTFNGLVDIMKTVGRYWFEIVELPKVKLS